jgi:aspartyl-tRNA(Asn)/glutamyl-tRNA(Gln) amidotransferase subunit A
MAAATLDTIADELASGRTSSRRLVEQCLARIVDPNGQGATVFLQVDETAALGAADAMDRLRSARAAPSRYAGIPVSVKDLFDIEGQVTRAGSRVLASSPPARSTAPAVARLRAAGFVIIGRTNMTEFAFSGLGLNPHYGTPLSPWQRQDGHIAGGSTSGGAASVVDGMAYAALGTDTGGSCRIPAAFTGLVGFKPTASRVPKDGAVPLSRTLDCVGPIARSVNCCAIVDAVLSNETIPTFETRDLQGIRVLVPTTIALDNLDSMVASAFGRTLRILSEGGVHVTTAAVPEFAQIPAMNGKGGFAAAESYAWHATLLRNEGDRYDPKVSVRIRRGAQQSAADLISLMDARAELIDAVTARMSNFDVLVLPTVPIPPPRLKELEDEADYTRVNLLALRNPSIINLLDGCAISIPMHRATEPPMGLMIAACRGQDRTVFEVARVFEAALAIAAT